MLVRLSSKGQLVIPRAIRQALGLKPGNAIELHLKGKQVIIEPLGPASPIDRLYGKYAGLDLLRELEAEHRGELDNDPTLRS